MAQTSIAPRSTSLLRPVRRDASRPRVSQVSAQSALRRMHWTSSDVFFSARHASAQAMQACAQVNASSMNRAIASSACCGASGWAAIISLASMNPLKRLGLAFEAKAGPARQAQRRFHGLTFRRRYRSKKMKAARRYDGKWIVIGTRANPPRLHRV